jgi:hypothetical protein
MGIRNAKWRSRPSGGGRRWSKIATLGGFSRLSVVSMPETPAIRGWHWLCIPKVRGIQHRSKTQRSPVYFPSVPVFRPVQNPPTHPDLSRQTGWLISSSTLARRPLHRPLGFLFQAVRRGAGRPLPQPATREATQRPPAVRNPFRIRSSNPNRYPPNHCCDRWVSSQHATGDARQIQGVAQPSNRTRVNVPKANSPSSGP